MIPEGVQRILDCGCGAGDLGNLLMDRYKVVGCDVASPALSRCQFETVPASAVDMPFEDRSFDLLISSEVLEHLRPPDFELACPEMERLARRWIIVTVPNREDLDSARWQCPHCGTIFHDAWHVRSMSEQSIADAFRDFSPRQWFYMGHKQRLDSIWRARLRNRLFGYPTLPPSRHCPLCGEYGSDSGVLEAPTRELPPEAPSPPAAQRSRWNRALRRAALRVAPGRPRWLGCLLERK